MKAVVAVMVAGLLVSACGIFDRKVTYPCPAVFILDDAKDLVRFKPGPGRDITDILFEAEIVNFRGSCDYDEDDGRWTAEIELLVQIAVERGAANRNREIAFDYFAALPSFQSRSGGKSVFSVRGAFEGSRTRLLYQDEIKMLIPVEKPTDGSSLEIVLGFQLSLDELKYNRDRR